MKPQTMKARKALNKSDNSDAKCFDFNELLVALDATESRIEIPTSLNSVYDFTSLSKALSVAEKDNKSNEAKLVLEIRDETFRCFTSIFNGSTIAEVDIKIRKASLEVRKVIIKLRDEYRCDITILLKAKQVALNFFKEILKIRDESYHGITSLSKGLTVAEVDNRIREAMENFCCGITSLHKALRAVVVDNKAREASLKFKEALKVRNESRAFRRFGPSFGNYHSELGMAKRRHLRQQRMTYFA